MAKVLHQSAVINTAYNTAVRYQALGEGPGLSLAVTEADRQTTYRTAGVLSNLYALVTANDRTANSTIRVRKNGANGNQVLTIGAGLTGEFEDVVNTDAVVAGDEINYSAISSAGGTQLLISIQRTLFAATAGTVTIHNRGLGTILGGTFYSPLGGGVGDNTSEITNRMQTGTIGLMSNMFLYIVSNTRNVSSVITLRKNSANTSIAVTVPATTSGIFEDLVNTDTSAVGDLYDWQHLVNAGSGTVVAGVVKIEWSNTTKSFMLNGNGTQSIAAGSTVFWPSTGSIATSTAVENQVKADIGIRGRASRLRTRITTNTVTAASFVRLRKNNADGNQVVTITASTTGIFQDLVNKDSLVEADGINYSLTVGATGVDIDPSTVDMLMSTGAVKDVIDIHTIPWARP